MRRYAKETYSVKLSAVIAKGKRPDLGGRDMSHQSSTALLFSLTLFAFGLAFVPAYVASPQATVVQQSGFTEDRPPSSLFVVNSPSVASRGSDSLLIFDFRGNSRTFFSSKNNFIGLRNIACDPKKPHHIFVTHNSFPKTGGFLVFDASGQMDTVPSGTPGGNVSLAFDDTGNLYAAQTVAGTATVFKNDVSFATLPVTGIGQLAVDSVGHLYLTDPFISPRIFRIDPTGNVTVFADASKGLESPYGLAIDSANNVYVANNPGSRPAFILKLDPFGTATSFATGISFQPIIRSMVFDSNDNLYATLQNDNKILKINRHGNSSEFATGRNGLNYPGAVAIGTCRVEEEEKEFKRRN